MFVLMLMNVSYCCYVGCSVVVAIHVKDGCYSPEIPLSLIVKKRYFYKVSRSKLKRNESKINIFFYYSR